MQLASPRGAGPRATADNCIDQDLLTRTTPSPFRPSLQSQLQTGVVVIEVSRNPIALQQSLDADTQLQRMQCALSDAGLDPKLPTGAFVLVPLSQYRAVRMVAERLDLQRRHFVVSEDAEQVLQGLIQSLPGKEKVRVKSRQWISGLRLYTAEQDILAEVNRTFVNVPVSSSMRSRPQGQATCSTTDAHFQNARNPRKA